MKIMPTIVQDVASNLFEIGKSAVKSTASAVADVASESIEQVTSAPSQAGVQAADSTESKRTGEEQERLKMAEKQRFEEVKGELSRYMQRKQELDRKIAEEKAVEKNEGDKKSFEKKKKESFTQNLLKKLGAGSHGETDRQKE